MNSETPLSRRALIAAGGAGLAMLSLPGAARTPAAVTQQLEWLPGWKIRQLIAQKSLSPVELIKYLLQRIDSLDGSLGAFVALDREGALRAAKAAERAVLGGDRLGPLHGIPVSLKHMIAAQNLPLETGEVAMRDSAVTERIRSAGGIILGTTALSGPADMLGEAHTGAANPWDIERVSGSSSSGAAAAVAAGFCPIAIGSDGGGSTRIPAAWCGLVGLHPTTGRVPADHDRIRMMSRTAWSGTYGPITRDAQDAATVMSVIAGPDWRYTHSFNGPPPDYLGGVDGGVEGLRLAWARDLNGDSTHSDSAVVDAVQQAARGFSQLGAQVDEVQLTLGDWYPVFTRIAAEYSAGALYPLLSGGVRAWDKIRGETSSPLWTGELEQALAARQVMAQRLLALFGDYNILVTATSPVIAPTQEAYGKWLDSETFSPEYTCLTGHMNLLGFPAISVPAGLVKGMPVGMQLVARPDEDAKLLRAAKAYMQAFPWGHAGFR